MDKRLQLHQILVDILKPLLPEEATTSHVYFQPPESIRLEYPCIVYKRDRIDSKRANNKTYLNSTRYQVTTIDKNPDSSLVQKIAELPKSTHIRNFAHEELTHDIFDLYY